MTKDNDDWASLVKDMFEPDAHGICEVNYGIRRRDAISDLVDEAGEDGLLLLKERHPASWHDLAAIGEWMEMADQDPKKMGSCQVCHMELTEEPEAFVVAAPADVLKPGRYVSGVCRDCCTRDDNDLLCAVRNRAASNVSKRKLQ